MKKILIVDDSEAQQEFLGGALENQGYKIDTESNGSRAIYRVQEEAYDLILLDIHMPRIDGFTFLIGLRGASQNAKVIVVTADKSPETAELAEKYGVAEFMTKPVDIKELQEKVSYLINKTEDGDESGRKNI